MSDLSIEDPPQHGAAALARASRAGGAVRSVAHLLLRLADALDERWEQRRREGPPVSRLSDHLIRDIGLLPDRIERQR